MNFLAKSNTQTMNNFHTFEKDFKGFLKVRSLSKSTKRVNYPHNFDNTVTAAFKKHLKTYFYKKVCIVCTNLLINVGG